MFAHLKDAAQRLKHGTRGKRFLEYYEYRKKHHPHTLWRGIGVTLVGILMIAVGIFGMLIPIIPGFVFFIPGIAIVGSRSRYVATGLDRIELTVRKWIGR